MTEQVSGRGVLWIGVLLAATLGCDRKGAEPEGQGAAPPPIASSKPGACASGGGTVADAVARPFFPATAGSYCVDPNGETRAYGDNAPASLEAVCTELFDGECEVYRSFGLRRVVTLRYIDGEGSPGSVNVNLSTFSDQHGAYGFFTKRVLADRDPSEVTATALDAGAAGAIGSTIAYVWRGPHVAELSYTNELEAPDQLRASSRNILPVVSRLIGQKLPGALALPPAAAALPSANRLPLGISYQAKDALGVPGLGAGAVGFYQSGTERWRLFTSVGVDEAAANDITSLLKKSAGATLLKGGPFPALQCSVRQNEDGARTEWLIARHGTLVVGVADETPTGKLSKEDVERRRAHKFELLKPFMTGAAGGTTDGAAKPNGAEAPAR